MPMGAMLIINADDLGRIRTATDRGLHCHREGRVTAASAMVFMEDSARAAELALASGVDVGLHLNFTLPFTALGRSALLEDRQGRIVRYLTVNSYRLLFYNPALKNDFYYVYSAQVEEFSRLYGRLPDRIDGHHHMHLCANVLYAGLIPAGLKVRRNLYFTAGEKSIFGRLYRATVDAGLRRKYICTDYFFSLRPLSPVDRIRRITALARLSAVELAVHPEMTNEYEFLMSEDFVNCLAGVETSSFTKS
jgi:hypothetical protein